MVHAKLQRADRGRVGPNGWGLGLAQTEATLSPRVLCRQPRRLANVLNGWLQRFQAHNTGSLRLVRAQDALSNVTQEFPHQTLASEETELLPRYPARKSDARRLNRATGARVNISQICPRRADASGEVQQKPRVQTPRTEHPEDAADAEREISVETQKPFLSTAATESSWMQ